MGRPRANKSSECQRSSQRLREASVAPAERRSTRLLSTEREVTPQAIIETHSQSSPQDFDTISETSVRNESSTSNDKQNAQLSAAPGCKFVFEHRRSLMQKHHRLSFDNGECVLCGRLGSDNGESTGPMIKYGNLAVHQICLIASSGAEQCDEHGVPQLHNFSVKSIVTEFKRGMKLTCFYCKKRGATVGCVHTECKITFHLPCGKENGVFMQYHASFPAFCTKHIPEAPSEGSHGRHGQCHPSRSMITMSHAHNNCNICAKSIPMRAITNQVIRTTCCGGLTKGKSQFYRYYCFDCLKQYAMHHRSWTRCPMHCESGLDNIEQYQHCAFQIQVLQSGIWIPDGDITAEEDGQYDDLLKHNTFCYMGSDCKCPYGINFQEDAGEEDSEIPLKWELLKACEQCGSVYIHRECAGLPWSDMDAFKKKDTNEVETDESEELWKCNMCINRATPSNISGGHARVVESQGVVALMQTLTTSRQGVEARHFTPVDLAHRGNVQYHVVHKTNTHITPHIKPGDVNSEENLLKEIEYVHLDDSEEKHDDHSLVDETKENVDEEDEVVFLEEVRGQTDKTKETNVDVKEELLPLKRSVKTRVILNCDDYESDDQTTNESRAKNNNDMSRVRRLSLVNKRKLQRTSSEEDEECSSGVSRVDSYGHYSLRKTPPKKRRFDSASPHKARSSREYLLPKHITYYSPPSSPILI